MSFMEFTEQATPVLCGIAVGAAVAAIIVLAKAWTVYREACRRNARLKSKCAELCAAVEAANRSGDLLPADRKHKEI